MEEPMHVLVDSRDRDRPHATAPSSYTYTFDDPMRNVASAELISAIFAPTGPNPHAYVNLLIEELRPSSTWSKNHILRDSFAQLSLGGGDVAHEHDGCRGAQTFPKPLAKVGKLTVRFACHDGREFSDMPEHLLVLRLVRLVPKFPSPGTDASLRLLGISSSASIPELNQAYAQRKAELLRTGAHTSEMILLKAAYKDLYRRSA